MNEDKRSRITVEIHNRKYTIVGDASSDHIKMVAGLVDQKMDELQFYKPSLDTSQLAVLTAVNTMSDYLKLKQEYEALKNQLNHRNRRKEDRK